MFYKGSWIKPHGPALLYDYALTDSLYDGMTSISVSGAYYAWAGFGPTALISDSGIAGSITHATWSFPAVNLAQGSAVSHAELDFYIYYQSASSGFTVNLHGEEPQAASSRWGTGGPTGHMSYHTPPDPVGPLTPIASVTGIDPTVGQRHIDVTAVVQLMLNHADWASGDFMNFWLEVVSSPGVARNIATVCTDNSGYPSQAARLTIE